MMKQNLPIVLSAAMLFLVLGAGAQDGLFISEILDPADDYSGRYIELFNAGSEAVDFAVTPVYLSRQSNGGTSWGDLLLEGIVAAGETFVIGGSGFADLYGFVPDQETGILIGNGDDTYGLFRDGDHASGTLHDIFGAIDVDGTGEPWEYTDKRGVRLEGVTAPNTTWTAAEWELVAANVADGDPGIHHGMGGGDLPEPGVHILAAGNDTVTVGDTATVPVNVSYLTTADDVISWQFRMVYDSSVLAYAGYSLSGTLSENGTVAINSDSAGFLWVSFMQQDPLTGEGTLVDLHFTTLLPDTTVLDITGAYLNNLPLDDLTAGEVIVSSGAPPSAAITYNDSVHRLADTLLITATFSASMNPAVPVTFSMEGAATLEDAVMTRVNDTVYLYEYIVPRTGGVVNVQLTGGSDLWGNTVMPTPVSGENFSIVPITPGDVDDDGRILAYDAALTLQHSVGLDPLPGTDPLPWEPWRDSTANLDGVAGITANDAAMILQYSAGLLQTLGGSQKKAQSAADVTATTTGNEVILYSHGELVGLNVRITGENQRLGIPEVRSEQLLSAVHVDGDDYRVGLCTAEPLPDGSELMRIPYDGQGTVTISMLVNQDEKELTLDLSTGRRVFFESRIVVYPNPTGGRIFIRAGEEGLPEGARIRITDLQGRLLLERTVGELTGAVDLSNLSADGMFYLQVTGVNGQPLFSEKLILNGKE